MIALVDKAARALRSDMVRSGHARGFTEIQPAHNALFATLPPEGARAADMAARYGITRQSMGEIIRELVKLDVVEMVPDPTDGRAKIVTYTEYGKKVASSGFQHIVEIDQMFREKFGDADVDAAKRVMAGIVELLGDGLDVAPLSARSQSV